MPGLYNFNLKQNPMPFNPGVSYNPAPIYQGLASGASDLANAMIQKKQEEDQMKDFAARSRSTESFLKTHASDLGLNADQVNEMIAPQLDETPRAKYLRLSDTLSNGITGITLKANAQKQMQEQQAAELDARVKNAQLAQYQQHAAQDVANRGALRNSFDPEMAATASQLLQGSKFNQMAPGARIDDPLAAYTAQGGDDPQQMQVLAQHAIANMKQNKPMPGSAGYGVKDVPGVGRMVIDTATGEPIDSGKFTKPDKTDEKPPTEAQVTFDTNLDVAMKKLDEFESTVKKYGNAESGMGNADAHAKLGQLPYQLAILTAKIVDPATAAREGEVAAAQKYLLPAGWFTNNSTTLAAIDNLRNTFKQYGNARTASQQIARPQPGVAPMSAPPALAAGGLSAEAARAELARRRAGKK